MKLNRLSKREILAGEYVLGTLQGSARKRFERELSRDAILRAEVEAWERDFFCCDEHVIPDTPPERVWQSIDRFIGEEKRLGLWSSLSFWRHLGAWSLAVAIFLLAYLGSHFRMIFPDGPAFISVLNDKQASAQYLIYIPREQKQVRVVILQAPRLNAQQVPELWLLPRGDGSPISLGILPKEGEATLPLTPLVKRALTRAEGLAISVELAGGSKTGTPTEPMVMEGGLMSFI